MEYEKGEDVHQHINRWITCAYNKPMLENELSECLILLTEQTKTNKKTNIQKYINFVLKALNLS